MTPGEYDAVPTVRSTCKSPLMSTMVPNVTMNQAHVGFVIASRVPQKENGCRDTVHNDETCFADWRSDNAGRPTDKSFAAPPFLAEMGKVARREYQPPPVRASQSARHARD
jgi:hypothetical protein